MMRGLLITAVRDRTRLLLSVSLAWLAAFGVQVARAQEMRDLPAGKTVDQLCISGNACGPAALLNALRSAEGAWRAVADRMPGKGDRGQLRYLIRAYGLRPSESLRGRPRWSRNGINVNDLTVMANEVCSGGFHLKWKSVVLGFTARDLKLAHDRMEDSLDRGLPPIVSVRRFVHRKVGDRYMWLPLEGHFVTVISVPKKLPRGATSFAVRYIDPWGGKTQAGEIHIETPPSGCGLIANFPHAKVGKSKVRPGERTVLVGAAVLGSW